MTVVDRQAPNGAVRFRDALRFARHSYSYVARRKNQEKLTALCDRMAIRAAARQGMGELSAAQLECIRKALVATAAIDGVDAHRKASVAKKELAFLGGLLVVMSVASGILAGSAGIAAATFALGVPYVAIRAVADPFSRVVVGFEGVSDLQDKIWSAIVSVAEAEQGAEKGKAADLQGKAGRPPASGAWAGKEKE